MAIRKSWLPLIIYLVGIVFTHHPMLFSGMQKVQTNPEDTRLINYLLEHSFQWVRGNSLHRDLWSPPFFYPAPNALAYSDTLLSAGPLYWPWRLAGLPPDTSFQFWMMTCGTVNYVVFLLLLLKVLPLRPGPAAMGAFLFAFGSSRINYLANPQLLPHFFSIIAILALLRIFDSRAVPRWQRTGEWSFGLLAVVAQLYSSFYMGWFFVFAMGVAFCWVLSDRRLRPRLVAVLRRDVIPIGLALVVAVALISPLLTHYLEVAAMVGYRSSVEVGLGMPLFRSWIYMGPDSWLYGWMPGLHWFLVFGSLEPAQRLGVGLAALVVCLIGLMRGWENPIIRVFGLTGLTLFLVVSPIPRGVILGLALMEWVLWPTVLLQAGGKRETRFIAMLLFALLCWVLFPGFSLFKMCVCWAPVLAAGETVLRRQRMFLYATAAMVCTLFLIGTTFLNMYDVLVTAFVGILIACFWHRSTGRTITPLVSAVAVLATVMVLVVVPGELNLWKLVYRFVPGAAAIRVVARVALLLLVPLAAGFAVFWERIGSRASWKYAVLLGLFCLLEQGTSTTTFTKQVARVRVENIASVVKDAGTPVAFFHSPHAHGPATWIDHIDALWAGLATGVPHHQWLFRCRAAGLGAALFCSGIGRLGPAARASVAS